jgi:glyoxylase-like metal-dependent hydrolase (beta-lactamase superfamily II)
MNVDIVELNTQYKGQDIVLHLSLLQSGGETFLVDAGYDESFDDLLKALARKQIDPQRIDGILVSHDDIDHIGGLHRFRTLNPQVRIYASAIEAPSLSGAVKSERLDQAERMFDQMPDAYKPWALDFQESLRNIQRVPVDITLEDRAYIGQDIEVVHTPGHTKGHLSFYLPAIKTLVASDAFVIENEVFEIANPQFTLDLPAAIDSLRKISALDIETTICYHGGVARGNIRQRLEALIAQYSEQGKA